MTLLIVTNLSDRIYMSADTRLSRRKSSGEIETIHDNQLKIEAISNNLIVGCAGSASMASFIIRLIKRRIDDTVGIHECRNILEESIAEIVDQYLVSSSEKHTYYSSRVVLIIAGFNRNQNKKIDFSRYYNLLGKYQEAKQQEVDDLFKGKEIKDFNNKELHQLKILMMAGRQGMKDIISNSIKDSQNNDGYLDLPINDQNAFVLEIDCSKKDPFSFLECPFGSSYVRGSSLDERILPETFWGRLEFGYNSNIEKDGLNFIKEISQRFSDSINGTVTNYTLIDNKIITTTGKVFIEDGITGDLNYLCGTKMVDGELVRLDNRNIEYPLLKISNFSADENLLL